MQKIDFHTPQQADKILIERLNKQFVPYADTAYGTLITWWNFYNDLEFAELNGNVIVKSSYPSMGEYVTFGIIGAHKVHDTLDTIFTWLESQNMKRELYFVPEYVIDALSEDKRVALHIENDPDIAEYVLSVEEQAKLAGKTFTHLRYKKNLFEARHRNDISLTEIDLTRSKKRKELLKFIKTWKPKTNNDIENTELGIIMQSLDEYKEVGTHVFTINIQNQPVAITFFKLLPNGHVNVNHIKVDYSYKQVFTFAIYALAQYLDSEYGAIYMNIEQDLGIPGLRHFKQLQRPFTMHNKYTVKLSR